MPYNISLVSHTKRISIIIPAYNEERHLRRCLNAIAIQTMTPHEVILIDNNSTDSTAAIARSYPFITYMPCADQGVVYARDVGFNAASGDIIARIDADTELPADWLERVETFYANPAHETQALTGGVVCYNLRLRRLISWIQGQVVFRFNRFLLGHYILFGTNMALPVALWQAVRDQTCTRTDIHEDLDLSIHLHQQGYQIAYQETLKVGAKMRRVRSERGELWKNLLLWPNTLRVHGSSRWLGAWLGAAFLWMISWLGPVNEAIARFFGRPPRFDD